MRRKVVVYTRVVIDNVCHEVDLVAVQICVGSIANGVIDYLWQELRRSHYTTRCLNEERSPCLSIQNSCGNISINQIASLKYHFGDVNAGWWYIKHECNRYTSTKFLHSLTLIL